MITEHFRNYSLPWLLLISSCTGYPPNDSNDVARLEKILPTLRQERIIIFRDQDWCKVLAISNKVFATNDASTCKLQSEKSEEFTHREHAIHGKIRDELVRANVDVTIIGPISYDADGAISFVEFELRRLFTRERYVYEPGYDIPSDMGNELKYRAINSDWYHVWEDWN